MVSVIIPTSTGGFMHLAKLMPSISQEEDCEIIVIDNNSRDNTMNYLSGYNCLVKVNQNKMNFSQSNNYGASKASGEYLLFLNNDTVTTKGFTKEMVKIFNSDPKIGIVGCLIYTMTLPKQIQHIGVMFTQEYFPYELGQPIQGITPGIPKNDPRVLSVREVPSVTAACMMIRKDVFNEVGGFDEGYSFGWEDTDLSLKVREKGYKVYYTGKGNIHHFHYGSKAIGRFNSEIENRNRYEEIWVKTGRAKEVLNGFREN